MSDLTLDTEVVIDLTVPPDPAGAPITPPSLLLGLAAVDSPAVAWALRARVAPPAPSIHLLVPATPVPSTQLAMIRGEHLDRQLETPAVALARYRLTRALVLLRELGLDASGEIGPPDPVAAVREAVSRTVVDEVVVPVVPTARHRRRAHALARRLHRHCQVSVVELALTGSGAPRAR